MVTLTAPGKDVLPWDRTQCRHSAGVRCSGEIGCVVEAQAMAIWHDDIGIRLSRVFEDVRRALNPGETSVPVAERSTRFEYMRTYEPQKRGPLHVHMMTRLSGRLVTDRRFRQVFAEAARAHGFGDELRVDQVNLADPLNAARSAGYVAKYNTKLADALPTVCRLNPDTGEIRFGGMRSWSASRGWGDTMMMVRQRRCQWAILNASTSGATTAPAGGDPGDAEGGALDLYQDGSATVGDQVPDCCPSSSTLLV